MTLQADCGDAGLENPSADIEGRFRQSKRNEKRIEGTDFEKDPHHGRRGGSRHHHVSRQVLIDFPSSPSPGGARQKNARFRGLKKSIKKVARHCLYKLYPNGRHASHTLSRCTCHSFSCLTAPSSREKEIVRRAYRTRPFAIGIHP